MSAVSRRRFLHVSAGAAAAGAALGVTGRATAATSAADALADFAPEHPGRGPVVVYLADARSSELSIMREGSEVVVRDRALARRLLAAAGPGEV